MELVGGAPDIRAGRCHRIRAGGCLCEAANRGRVTPEPQRQHSNTLLGPITRVNQRHGCFGVLKIVVVAIRHRLPAAVNDRRLGERCVVMGYQSTVRLGAPAICPRSKYLVGRIVIVIFKIVHEKEIRCRKAPDIAYPWTVGVDVIDLINTPVVGGIPL